MNLWISPHALHRYQEHHPEASRGDLRAAFGESSEMDPALFRSLTARVKPRPDDTYHLAPDQRGVFVRYQNPKIGKTLIKTYIRLGLEAQEILSNPPEIEVPDPQPENPPDFYESLTPEQQQVLGGLRREVLEILNLLYPRRGKVRFDLSLPYDHIISMMRVVMDGMRLTKGKRSAQWKLGNRRVRVRCPRGQNYFEVVSALDE